MKYEMLKKTAERILLELKNSINAFNGITLENYAEVTSTGLDDSISSEAISVLVNMGLTKIEASKIIQKVREPNDTIEEIITKALRNMS